MAERRRLREISVERTVPLESGEPPVTIRLSANLEGSAETDQEDADTASSELLRELLEQLDRVVRQTPGLRPPPMRADRSTPELIQAYRPRQVELVDLLAQEGELTSSEAQRLREYLQHPAAEGRAPAEGTIPQPIAAAPLARDQTPTTPRSVEELLGRYEIKNLKQAGAVRARRQISYEEYMSLRRHFAKVEPAGPDAPSSRASD